MKKITSKYSSFEILIILFFTISIFPFIILSVCIHPLGLHEWDWITNLGGHLNDLSLFEIQTYYYYNVMGRFSSTFISSLTPFLYTLSSFKIFFILNLLISYLILFAFVKLLTESKSNIKVFAIASVLWMIFISGLSGVYDSLYMLTSVHTYLFGSYGFLLLALLWRQYFTGLNHRRIIKISIILISIFCIGTNELTLLFTVALTILIVVKNFKRIRQDKIFIYSLLVISSAFIFIALFSPANFERHDAYNSDISFFKLVFLAFSTSVFNFTGWLVNGNIIIGFLLLISLLSDEKIPALSFLKVKNKFFISGLIISLIIGNSMLVFSTNGMSLAERVVDHLFLYFLIGVFIILLLNLNDEAGFLKRVSGKLENKFIKYSLVVVFILTSFIQGLNLDRKDNSIKNYFSLIKTSSNIGNAWLAILDGTVFDYNKEMNEQYIILEKCVSDTCIVKKPKHTHDFLYFMKADRRNTKYGDPFMGYYFNPAIKSVKY